MKLSECKYEGDMTQISKAIAQKLSDLFLVNVFMLSMLRVSF